LHVVLAEIVSLSLVFSRMSRIASCIAPRAALLSSFVVSTQMVLLGSYQRAPRYSALAGGAPISDIDATIPSESGTVRTRAMIFFMTHSDPPRVSMKITMTHDGATCTSQTGFDDAFDFDNGAGHGMF
jgi:hypothetical protein